MKVGKRLLYQLTKSLDFTLVVPAVISMGYLGPTWLTVTKYKDKTHFYTNLTLTKVKVTLFISQAHQRILGKVGSSSKRCPKVAKGRAGLLFEYGKSKLQLAYCCILVR